MAKRGVLQVATCQFAVSGNIRRNAASVLRQMQQMKQRGAEVIHFPECALSGYAGSDVKTWDGYDWDLLRSETEAICRLAKALKVWVILGSSHPLSGKHLPHNCVYVIDKQGRVQDRYDKRFCTGGDLRHYSPGDHLSVFDINGVRCGVLICYDSRFPELYRAYKKRDVQVLFHSYYNARHQGPNILGTITWPTIQTRAATNYFWISANNASGYHQAWGSVLVRPDGSVAASVKRNRAGAMVNEVDTLVKYYDASAPYRERAMKGILYSGKLVKDARSRDRVHL